MWEEFKKFILRGNVLDLAIAVIIGVAFGAIVTSLVNDLIMPLVGIIVGGVNFTGLILTVGTAELKYGNFLQALVNFLIIAFVMFMVVKAASRFQKKAPPPTPVKTDETVVLEEIRDLLRQRPL